ncbi:hypothetical protein [Maribacter halichondriae]|uniref:hypothetical protein n=1 Tax=Maribacter halichondriae TaxID=2980554 RepID=UPI00235A1495|nr:hypothetical protein [Maribacter sp. Hal144]
MKVFSYLQKRNPLFVLFTLMLLAISIPSYATTTPSAVQPEDTKGLFSIQFSWNKESFNDITRIEIEYKRKGLLNKKKVSGKTALYAKKNEFINLELREGEYEMTGIKIRSSEFAYNQYLSVSIDEPFVIKPGQVTNGGMIFLIRENKEAKSVMLLKMDNTADVKQYVNIYMPAYEAKLSSLQPAWIFLEKKTVDKLITSFAHAIVKNENRNPRKNMKYLRTTLGMAFKMTQNEDGKITSYELIPTPTYQEIKAMKILPGGKLLCTLENGSYLYGDDEGLDFMPLPKGLEKIPELSLIKGGRFLLVDAHFNIFSADASFNWKDQLAYRKEQQSGGLFTIFPTVTYPKIYKGNDHIYIYSPKEEKDPILLQSSYDNIDFQPVALSEEVKKVPLVSETATHIFVGPILKQSATAKRPAYLYVKEHTAPGWTVRNLPRGDCNKFSPAEDGSVLYTECSKDNWFESRDVGQSWSKWKESK